MKGKRRYEPGSVPRATQRRHLAWTDCRDVGCGGTTIEMYPTPAGVECVWTNENCPHGPADERGAALDGSNVSVIPWADFIAPAAHAPGRTPR